MNVMQLTTVPAKFSISPTSSALSHCAKINARYGQDASKFLTVKERLDSTIDNLPHDSQIRARKMIGAAIDEFSRLYPNVTSFSGLNLCQAVLIGLDQILIDDTMQRPLGLPWSGQIVANFKEHTVAPIYVYKVDSTGYDKQMYACWDGQHTAIALYLIATGVFHETNVNVPVVIFQATQKAAIRETFIAVSTPEGKKLLDKIDIYQQQVHGVRTDNSNNPIWKITEQKQQYLEQNNLFLTAPKLGDYDEAGAIGRAEEIVSEDPATVKELAMYLGLSTRGLRAAEPGEVWTMTHWFAMARKTRAEYSMADIKKLHKLFSEKFAADFSAGGAFFTLVKDAYLADHAEKTALYTKAKLHHLIKRPRFTNKWDQSGTYLWHLVNTYFDGPIPELTTDAPFTPKV